MADKSNNARVFTMPAEFYGGANPVIKFKQVEKEYAVGGGPTAPTPAERVLAEKRNAAGGQNRWHPANFLTNPKSMFLAAGAIFVLLVLGGAVYYYIQTRRASVAVIPSPAPPVQPAPADESSRLGEEAVVTTTPIAVDDFATSTDDILTFTDEVPLQFPARTVGTGADMDQDGLTDEEENLFGTDPAVPDTDSDSYNDSHEAYYLYDPNQSELGRLIDSGGFYDFSNPVFGYKVYYPASWFSGNVDGDYEEVLFSGISGENIEVRSFTMRPGEAFADWFGRLATGELYSDLEVFSSYFGAVGWARNDGLVYYFPDNGRVYALVHHLGGAGGINFKSVITVMARSFRLPVLPPSGL